MKHISEILLILFFIMCLPLTTVYSYENNIQRVGFDIDEYEGYDGGANPQIPENIEIENNESNDSSNDNPVEYDPDNPYAEWER